MLDGIVGIYHDKLFSQETTNKGLLLAKFFSELFGLQLSQENIIMFNKLLKLYGAENVFFATLSSYESGADPSKIYGLLSYICKKKLTSKESSASSPSLQKLAESIEEKANRKTNLKIRSPFDE